MEQRLELRLSTLFWYAFTFLFGTTLFGYALFKYLENPDSSEKLAITFLLFILGLLAIPCVFLTITYLYTDLTKQVFMDKEKKQLRIRSGRKDLFITSASVVKSYHVKSVRYRSHRLFREYEYILLVLPERKRIFITNLLTEPDEIASLLTLNCQEIEMNIPFLDIWLGGGVLKKEERHKKVQEYRTLFQSFPNNKLQAITRNREDYDDMAREAASQLLKERK